MFQIRELRLVNLLCLWLVLELTRTVAGIRIRILNLGGENALACDVFLKLAPKCLLFVGIRELVLYLFFIVYVLL